MCTTSFVMPNDLSDLCRVCLQLPEESQYLDLTTIYDEEDNLTYGECFTICTQIDLSAGEGVPHHLCKTCGLELQMSYDFHKKIEESKRVIEQCQRQIQEQKENVADLLANHEESNKQNSQLEDESSLAQFINNKYIINEDEMELAVTSQELEEENEETIVHHENEENFHPANETNEETDELDILSKMCQNDITTNKDYPSLEVGNVTNITAEAEEHLDVEDYQNLEALEEEETETLQIKCGENSIPIQITKYKAIECGNNEEYVEFEEEENEVEEELEVVDEIDEDYAEETNEQDMGEHLRWQNNVVAVASKEHLPIEIEDDLDEEKLNENQILLCESSQDEAIEEEEEVNENESNTNESINNKCSNDNNTTRKRHVGSYSCDYCQRVFPNYSRMKTHRRCHESDRPKFSCSHCGRMYATKQARDSHVQTAHEKSGYTCSICNKVFAIRKSLEIHIRYHTGDFPYACKLCDRKFAQACHLNTHINVKHNKIRFSCDYPGCGKFFTSSTSLRNHEYTHGVMPFECEYCRQGYPAKAKLRIHIQRKHGLELNKDQLEKMRKFHVMRSKVNLVQFVDT